MAELGIFFADKCEEIEGLAVVDIIRRAKMNITSISITAEPRVTGSHNITFETDTVLEEVDFDKLDGIILPGGMPGTLNLGANEKVTEAVKKFAKEGKMVAAICAAPSVLGACGVLEGKNACCHPGFEDKLTGANVLYENVVTDKNVITSRGMGTVIDFGLAIVSYFGDEELLADVKKHLVYNK
ncbi:MAG: DJ-1 family glyoxalase III [Lachnospiraceae bacterium]|nr:DJ-1 family glyoxalase III [Lachnospiraceae bacterium]